MYLLKLFHYLGKVKLQDPKVLTIPDLSPNSAFGFLEGRITHAVPCQRALKKWGRGSGCSPHSVGKSKVLARPQIQMCDAAIKLNPSLFKIELPFVMVKSSL